MNKKVLVISTSLRQGKTSDTLASAFSKGAMAAGHNVERISLAKKTIGFCTGCLACQKTQTCSLRDDVEEIINKIKDADVIAFATPIYFYEMSGQMKTLLDRSNPLFTIPYSFQDIYLLATAADEDESAMDGAIKGLQGWIDCFDKAQLKGVVRGLGSDEWESMDALPAVKDAYELGKAV